MNISKKELMRIADICLLEFTDEEYDFLKRSLETSLTEAKVLFMSEDNDVADDGQGILSKSRIEELTKESLMYCEILGDTKS